MTDQCPNNAKAVCLSADLHRVRDVTDAPAKLNLIDGSE
jgi:hypothetical protein